MAIIKFKVSRDRCYTVVSNTFINDNTLDAREKGILLVLMRLLEQFRLMIASCVFCMMVYSSSPAFTCRWSMIWLLP